MSHAKSNLIQSEIARSLDFLAGDPDLVFVMVFGSAAIGNLRPDSDLDVAVYPKRKLTSHQRQRLADQIACATGRTVDLVDLTEADGALLRQILGKGKILFSKEPGIPGRLSERLLDWQEDFEPQLNALLASRLQRFTSAVHGS
jgi:predicted nucleotidyltransferase